MLTPLGSLSWAVPCGNGKMTPTVEVRGPVLQSLSSRIQYDGNPSQARACDGSGFVAAAPGAGTASASSMPVLPSVCFDSILHLWGDVCSFRLRTTNESLTM